MPESNPVVPSDAVTASADPQRVGPLRRALARAEAYGAHHGIWAAGERLQCNLDLRLKVALAGFLVGLPLCFFVAQSALREWTAFEQSTQRRASLEQMRSLSVLARSVTSVQREALTLELGLPGGALPRALQADQDRFDAFLQGFAADEWPASTRRAVTHLETRRQAMLKQAGNTSLDALPGHGSPRIEAMADYAREILHMRTEVARANAPDAQTPSAIRALDESLARTLPLLRWHVARSVGLGAPLYESADREARSQRLLQLMAQANVHLEALESDLVHAMDQGHIDAAVVRASMPTVKAQLALVHQLAIAAPQATSGVELTVVAGLPREGYLRSGGLAIEALNALEDAAFEGLNAWTEAQAETQRRQLYLVSALTGLWLLVTTYLLVCGYRALSGGLRSLVVHLESIGSGNLSQRPQGHGSDEIGRALNALAASSGHMAQLFGAVTQGVAAVSQASREVAGGNAGLSSRSTDVQRLIADVAGRAQSCSTSLDHCGDQVEQTAELVHEMRADGQRGRKAVGGLREGMARLQGKSREIGQVVSLVEAVAYQTKLLSINASVEAARAGEAGKGFAVVAQEVRALAVRSEAAAQRIAGIVNASIEEIETCGLMAERTDEAVQRNEAKIEEVDALMRDTVRLTRAGRTDSQEVLAIARSVEDTMNGNVRVVEQLANASASLRTQGDHLKRSLRHFIFG